MHIPGRRSRSTLVAVVALVVATWTVLAPATAGAHAILVATSPEAGALLDEAPTQVAVTFDEPVVHDETSIVVVDESGDRVGGVPQASGSTVSAPVPDGTGWFAVSWHVVSADGHPLSGAWTYRVGEGSDTAPDDLVELATEGTSASTGARWAWTISQWASALTSVVLLGTAFVMAITPPADGHRRLALSAGLLAVVTSLLAAGANGPHIGPQVGWFDGPASDELLVRAVLAALAVATLLLGRAGGMPTLRRLAPVVLAAGALTIAVRSGHAGSEGGAAVAAVMAHLVVAGCWLGAVPAVLIGVRPGGDAARLVLSRFSRAATWLLVAVVVCGLAGAALLSGGPSEVASEWGAILVAKLAFVAMAALAGGWTRFNVLPHLDELRPRDVRAPLLFDAVALVAIVTASIALTHNGPPREVSFAGDAGASEPVTIVGESDEVTVQVVVDPAVVGPNDLHVFITDPTGVPTAVEEITITLASEELGIGAIPVELSDYGAGHLSTRIDDLGLAGTWELAAVVRPTTFTQFEIAESFEVRE